MKKLLAIIIVLVMLLTIISGCSGGKKSDNKNDSINQTEQAAKEPTKILWAAGGSGSNIPSKDGIVVKALEEKFNVDISYFGSTFVDNKEQFTIKIGSGEIPDVWYDWNTDTWWEQGILRTVMEELIKQYMPKTYGDIFLKLDPKKMAFSVRKTEDGDLKGIPQLSLAGASYFIRVYRQDWLDKFNLKVPTTVEELENVIKVFTKDDPDGNDKNDTYGVNVQSNMVGFSDVFGTFGIAPGIWVLKNDKVVFSDTTNEYKEALKILARWYADGYINPECLTDSFETFTSKFADGKIGSYYQNWYWASSDQTNTPVSMLLKKDLNAKVVYGDAIKGPNGEAGSYGFGPDLGWTVQFRKGLSDEVVIKVMQIIEYLSTDIEGFKLHHGGIEDKTYIIEDGMIKNNLLPEEKIKEGIDVFPFFTGEKFKDLYWGTGESGKLFDLGTKQPWITNVIGRSPLVKAREKGIGTDIGKVREEFYWNVITGKVNADTEWDAYQKRLNDNGLQEMTEEANEIYDSVYRK
ncbi:MAG TPA: hypothetical protein PK733_17320 [Clostridiales bacterium]|nr:hypothetical protein [Clostridiales bacterium]